MAHTGLRARRGLHVVPPRLRHVAALTSLAALLGAFASSASATVRIVSTTKSGANYYSAIQSAVNASHAGDWVLIEPGVYDESVRVQTPNLHIRGMNRNTVILDGQSKGAPGGRNG